MNENDLKFKSALVILLIYNNQILDYFKIL